MSRNERLRQHRIARNWHQKEVADQLGATLVTVQRWERRYQEPSAYYRVKLCKLFGLSPQELGLLEEPPPVASPESEAKDPVEPDAIPSDEMALWTVPHARNPHFTGRDDLLARLTQQFSTQESSQPTSIRQAALTQSYAIKGLGGVGKTQIAVEYAYRCYEQGRYTHTLWMNAASEEAILKSYAGLAKLLPDVACASETDQRKLVTALICWLEECSQPWLLIVDNADDLSFVPQYLPTRGNGRILFTTRHSAVGSLSPSIEVDCMGLMEGAYLLLRRAQREASATDDEIDEAINIAVALSQFPLALDQAGAYIEETGCSLHEYLLLYQQHQYALLARRGKQAWHYPEPVATTWSLSFHRVGQANPAAAELLRVCAFLAPDRIPQELLTEGAAHWPPALQQAAADPLAFDQMLEILLAFSLVRRLSEDRLLSVHRLVQVVQIEHISVEEQRQWAERVVYAVNAIFPRTTHESASWPQCLRYLEQVQICDTLIQQHQLLFPEAADVLNRAGSYLVSAALYGLAEPLYQRVLHIRERLLGPDHPDVVVSLDNLAHLYLDQGKFAQAEMFYQRTLCIMEQRLGSEHLDLAWPLNGLASVYNTQGKYTQAEPLYQQALRIWEQQLGPEHPDLAYSLNGLANLYKGQGKFAQAEMFYQRALCIMEQLGPDHPYTANLLNNLADVYRMQGKYAQAEPIFRRTLRIMEQQRGPDYPLRAHPLSGLAELFYEQGDYAQAEPLYQQALRIWEQQLGPEHPDLAWPLNGLGNICSEQGRFAQAEAFFQRALRIREQQLGPEHAETAHTLYDLARFWELQGNCEEACTWYRRAMAIQEPVLGAQHPGTTKTRTRFRNLLHAMGRFEDAARLEIAQSEWQ